MIDLDDPVRPHMSEGIDPWSAALDRARTKIAARNTPNVTVHEGSASNMPFPA